MPNPPLNDQGGTKGGLDRHLGFPHSWGKCPEGTKGAQPCHSERAARNLYVISAQAGASAGGTHIQKSEGDALPFLRQQKGDAASEARRRGFTATPSKPPCIPP